ncbi:hypothetical protein DL96DRAFT_1703720 [Flagelloscypha sp. PMI_526]|nr:hypothetical protein DL96DRAFT_1703720 [Flagelloscypha sp. PMI_526]
MSAERKAATGLQLYFHSRLLKATILQSYPKHRLRFTYERWINSSCTMGFSHKSTQQALAHFCLFTADDPFMPSLLWNLETPSSLASQFLSTSSNKPYPQTQSLFFTNVPPEVRHLIFAYVLTQCEDLSHPYDPLGYISRPGYRYPLLPHIDTAVLQTCRRAYLEGHIQLLELNLMKLEFRTYTSVHYGFSIAPFDGVLAPLEPDAVRTRNPRKLFGSLTEEKRKFVDVVTFFVDWRFLDSSMRTLFLWDGRAFRARVLKLILPHTAWSRWDEPRSLDFPRFWMGALREARDVEEVVLELETTERKKDQLFSIAEDVQRYSLELFDGQIATALQHPLEEWEWNGPSLFRETPTGHFGVKYNPSTQRWDGSILLRELDLDDPVYAKGMVYYVVRIRWTVRVTKCIGQA